MTGRRRTRSFLPSLRRALRTGRTGGIPVARAAALATGALLACASLAAGCGVLPGVTGGSRGSVTVMTWAPEKTRATNMPGMPAMARAYARWVNAHGGLDGRTLKVLTCNDHNDSVGAADCARRAVRENVAAVVGSYSQYGRSVLSPLEGAGIPYIGGYGITDDEFTSPLSYPVNGGQPALMAGMGEQLAGHCSRVALVRPDTIAGDDLPVLLDSGLAERRHPSAIDIRAAEDATEYTAQARDALSRVAVGATAPATSPASTTAGSPAARASQGCVMAALGDRTDTFFDSFRRSREDYPEVRVSSVLGSVDQSVIDRTGGQDSPYERAYLTGWYPAADDPRWDGMKKVISEQAFGDNRIDPADAGVQTTWIAYTVLKQAVEKIGDGDVSALSLRRTLDSGLKVDTGGLTPPLSWRFEDLIAVKGFPRLVNADVTFQVVRNGRMVSARRGFVNVSKTLERTS
ncbi:ABC transporter substrate-binding protein [Streptomyces sp. NPDC002004]